MGVHQFEYGWVTPVLAYLMSVVGSLLGLTATVRAQSATSSVLRARWLVLASFAIGGTGIWTMHFLAMIGFAVDGTAVRFDIATTIASWLTAVIVVGIGLFIVGFGRPSTLKVIAAGLLTGLGVAAMHYSGMYAMRVNGSIGYDRRYVIASIVIAVAAATVALWFTVIVRRPVFVVISALLMGVAISGMHYTGMYGLRVHIHESLQVVPGTEALSFLIPILVLVLVVIVALFYSLLAVPSQSDREIQDELRARIDGSHPDTRPATFADSQATFAGVQAGAARPASEPGGAFGGPTTGGATRAGSFGGPTGSGAFGGSTGGGFGGQQTGGAYGGQQTGGAFGGQPPAGRPAWNGSAPNASAPNGPNPHGRGPDGRGPGGGRRPAPERSTFGTPDWSTPTDGYPELADDWEPRHPPVLPGQAPRTRPAGTPPNSPYTGR